MADKKLDWLAGEFLATFEDLDFDRAYIEDKRHSLTGKDRLATVDFNAVMKGNSRPFRDSHDRPLYGKQFCDMEFICVPIADGHIVLFNAWLLGSAERLGVRITSSKKLKAWLISSVSILKQQ